MSTKRWVRVQKDPFGSENDDGYRIARIDSGVGYAQLTSTGTKDNADLSVLIAIRTSEDKPAELSIACGPTAELSETGMDLSKGVSFHGDLAVAVATIIAFGGSRLAAAQSGALGLGGVATFVVESDE
jgi:hypothetical protein